MLAVRVHMRIGRTHIYTPSTHPLTNAHMHTRTHARSHTHTNTRTHATAVLETYDVTGHYVAACTYTLEVKTADVEAAGTNDWFKLKMFEGMKRSHDIYVDNADKDDFERNQ